jgi:hypothetical protein
MNGKFHGTGTVGGGGGGGGGEGEEEEYFKCNDLNYNV